MKIQNRLFTRIVFSIIITVCLTLSLSCSGEDGETGLQGPAGKDGVAGVDGVDGADGQMGEQGPQGEQGEQGPQGEQGQQGEPGQNGVDGQDGQDGMDGQDGQDGMDGMDGNANVVASDWVQFSWDVLQGVNNRKGTMYIESFPPEVNIQTFLDTGGVILYYLRYTLAGTAQTIYPIPYVDNAQDLSFKATLVHNLITESILISVQAEHQVNNISVEQYANTDTYMFRYILVPATVAEANNLADNIPQTFGEAATLLGLD